MSPEAMEVNQYFSQTTWVLVSRQAISMSVPVLAATKLSSYTSLHRTDFCPDTLLYYCILLHSTQTIPLIKLSISYYGVSTTEPFLISGSFSFLHIVQSSLDIPLSNQQLLMYSNTPSQPIYIQKYLK